eukprot:TRINITY_DN65494_c0_g1_i1.p1 TRINITY_DN65494_c0_g1~~TRINITY_DN65494_c0_g1_i1.p1  ORF type:complete len:581 (+),score=77.99 TRINITY_DN65494_c0_g1_i1:82-1824(+)
MLKASVLCLIVASANSVGEVAPDSAVNRPRSTVGEGEVSHAAPDGESKAEARRLTRKAGAQIEGFIAGIVIWLVLPGFLWNNERIALKQSKLQGKALNYAVTVEDVDRQPIDELEGHIVFMSGTSSCKVSLRDQFFPRVTTSNAVKLRRIVEMYQTVETEYVKDGRKHYRYHEAWVDKYEVVAQDPSKRNPPMPLPSSQRSMQDYRASVASGDGEGVQCAEVPRDAVMVGAYYLGEYVRRELNAWFPKPVDASQLDYPPLLAHTYTNQPVAYVDPSTKLTWWMFGKQGIGQVRVRFEELRCGPVTLCGVLARSAAGWTIVPVVKEETTFRESMWTELGCHWFGVSESLNFTANPEDDEELIESLQDVDVEMDEQEMMLVSSMQTAHLSFHPEIPDDLVCTCCIPASKLVEMMHYQGLEEEFLGVAEKELTHYEMLGRERAAAEGRHCGARLCGMLTGCVATLLMIGPALDWLNMAWWLGFWGASFYSMALLVSSCLCSLTWTTGTIGLAWVRFRPRMVTVLAAVVLISWLCWFGFAAQQHATHAPGTPPTSPPAATTPIAAVGATSVGGYGSGSLQGADR